MRGANERQAQMLFGVTPDDLVPQTHPIRAIRELVDRMLAELSPIFCHDVLRAWSPVDSAGAPDEGHAAHGVLLHPLRAPVL